MSETDQHLTRTALQRLVQSQDLTQLDPATLIEYFRQEKGLQDQLPSGQVAIDPRNGDRVVFSPARAKRPHDQQPAPRPADPEKAGCPICAGKTTGVVDVAELSRGSTFINKNLYPSLFPFDDRSKAVRGLHFLQWTSTYHDTDWHNLPSEDQPIVLERLAALERKFVTADGVFGNRSAGSSFVSIIKNAGAAVGGSLSHGHQQIVVSNIKPRRVADNQRFASESGTRFSQHVLDELTDARLVRDYGPAVLAVPQFMKRPYDLLLLLKNTEKGFLFQLDEGEIEALAAGWHDASRLIHSVLPRLGKEIAYNVTLSNGPGAGLYLEFLPHSQITGGFELIGLYICQSSPERAARELRQTLTQSQ